MARSLAYLEPPGTFGEQAALRYDPEATLVPLPSHGAIVAAVSAGSVDEGIVAIENSLEGAVSETLDALLQHEAVFLRAELVLPIEQNLIAAPGSSLAQIRVVMSHPQALAQCHAYLEQHLPGVRYEAALSTAAAVAAAVKIPGAAAIGTRRAAEVSGGLILAEAIQDASLNKTRFVVLGRSDASPTGDDKTSVAFTTAHDRAGSLIAVLREISDRGINLTRVESRPSREDLGIYVFLIDLQGHRDDAIVAEALAAVKERSHYCRILGSYPRFFDSPLRGPRAT